MKIRKVKLQTIANLAKQGKLFISAMKNRKETNREQWNECFDGNLDPETMQPVPECNTTKEKCYLIENILRFLPNKVQNRIWGNKYILFFAVFWSETKSPDDITRERDKLNTGMNGLKSKSKKTGNRKKNKKNFHDS